LTWSNIGLARSTSSQTSFQHARESSSPPSDSRGHLSIETDVGEVWKEKSVIATLV
jgi:hypothetical protein